MIEKATAERVCEPVIVPVLAVDVPAAACNSSTINNPLTAAVGEELTRLVVEAGAVHVPTTGLPA
jgi:hypothetical protein